MRKRARTAALTLAFAGYGLVATAAPNGAVAAPRECPAGFEMEAGIGCTKALPNGNKLVHHAEGVQTETHGGDHEHAAVANDGQVLPAVAAERPVVCASSGSRSRAVYAYAAGSANRVDAVRSEIQAAVRATNGLLAQEATETGVVADFRFACGSDGQPHVTAIATTGADYSSIVNSARDAGLTTSTEDYWIFADFASPGGYSGVGTFYADDTLSASNANYRNAGYGITYSGYWGGATPMHEHGHNMGAVQSSAPDSSGAGHCDGYGSQDVMCYNDGGSQWDETHECGAVSGRHYDACHNDFFHTKPPAGSYLATKHNIGANRAWASFDNPFLAFGSGAVAPDPVSPTPTTATFTGGLSSVGTSRTHTFSAAGGTMASALKCSGGGKRWQSSSLRQEVLSPGGTVLGSLTVKCDGVSRQLTVTSSQAGSHALRITKTAGGSGTTSYTATVSYSA
ncbi:MAG: hypothetical protein M3Q48_12060 [Actinomycetota bacterium]|nr:hypothetical protein [Actinomycetota bacterium]